MTPTQSRCTQTYNYKAVRKPTCGLRGTGCISCWERYFARMRRLHKDKATTLAILGGRLSGKVEIHG
jgi:hypothetical protein